MDSNGCRRSFEQESAMTQAPAKKSLMAPFQTDALQLFLFSNTVLPSGQTIAESQHTYSTAAALSDEIQLSMSNAFPHVLMGSSFIDRGLEHMGQSDFIVLFICSDLRGKISERDLSVHRSLLNAGSILKQLAVPLHGVWGLMNAYTVGCMVPALNMNTCQHLATRIHHELADLQSETVSIGISVYPMADFNRLDTVMNAWKALNHASMKGSGSTVVFNATSLNISGDALYQAGDIPGAILEFQKALQLEPSNANIHNSLGVCYGVMERYDDAETEYAEALALNPDDVMALYNIGILRLMTGQRDDALAYFEKAVLLNDNIFEIAFQTGKLYYEFGHPEKAHPLLKKALGFHPNSGTVIRTLAACLLDLDLLHEAIALYTRAVKINPQDAESFSLLGELYDRIGENLEIAILFCQQSVAISPENDVYRKRLERLLKNNSRQEISL